MARTVRTLLATCLLGLLWAPAALASQPDNGQGLWGATNDKVTTNAGFILIAGFPLLILMLSLLQHSLDKRKNRRKAAAKARASRADLRGGW